MFPPRSIGLLALALGLVTMVVVDGLGPSPAGASSAGASRQVAAASLLPGIDTQIESCLGGGWVVPKNSFAGCTQWAKSGPINVVLFSNGAESPYHDTASQTQPRWKAAQGGWLVARLQSRGCGAGWHASQQQIELRLSKVARRHFKFIRPGCRWHGQWLTVGEAHTDLYDVRHCGGDHMTDLDLARDALVASLAAGGVVSRVAYSRWNLPGMTFPDGCGHQVPTDGLVAYAWLQD